MKVHTGVGILLTYLQTVPLAKNNWPCLGLNQGLRNKANLRASRGFSSSAELSPVSSVSDVNAFRSPSRLVSNFNRLKLPEPSSRASLMLTLDGTKIHTLPDSVPLACDGLSPEEMNS